MADTHVVAEAESAPSITLAALLNEFVDAGLTLKGNPASVQTQKKWSGTRNLLLKCFDGTRPLDSMNSNIP